MNLRLKNTRSGSTGRVRSISNGKEEIGIYTCGPTVYDFLHIGNYRAFVTADILKRSLIANGFTVNHIMNITDIDDKTIKKAIDTHKKLSEVTNFYTDQFIKELKELKLLLPDKLPRATEHINEMVEMIEVLIKKGNAYQSEDGSVYFKISTFKDYGKLSNLNLANLKEGASERTNNDEYGKDDVKDFVLWKAWTEEDGENFWETSLGKGRPGWHIECSAMSKKFLGEDFEIHTGGVDLIFPHHENEIAQSKCANTHEFADFFIHNEHLLIDGKKMSKSLKNIYQLKDLREKGFGPLDYKYFLYGAHYRQQQNFTFEALQAAQSAYRNLIHQLSTLPDGGEVSPEWRSKFMEAVNDDLNMPQALAVVWNILKSDINDADKLVTILSFDEVLGLDLVRAVEEQKNIPEDIKHKVIEREELRDQEDWEASDRLREEIKEAGYAIEDTDQGPRIFKL